MHSDTLQKSSRGNRRREINYEEDTLITGKWTIMAYLNAMTTSTDMFNASVRTMKHSRKHKKQTTRRFCFGMFMKQLSTNFDGG